MSKKKKPFQVALLSSGGVIAFLAMLACANLLAGALLFLSFGEHPGKAQFTTIEQAYSANPDARTMKKIRGSALIALLLCVAGPIALGLMLRRKKSDLFGNARFASKDDIKEEKLDARKGVVIGKFKNELLRLGGYEFVLLAAPTRTGKGVGFCVPNLLQFEDSAVVLDIKGENYNLTSEFRRRYMGNEIIYFNPFSENTHRWNPLSYVAKDPNFRASDLMALASIIYPVNDKDPFWSDAAKNLFVGLGLLVLETPELPQTIGEILRQGSGKGQPIDTYLTRVLELRAASERPLSAACRDSLSRFLGSGETALKGIVATFSATLTPFGNAVIDKATSANDFDLRDVRKKKMTIYLNIPAGEILQASFIVNLFFSQLINENVKELPEQNPALKYQCLLMLDEFTAMGKVAIIAKGVGYMAGYNMRLAIIIQDKTQLDAVYGKEDAHNIVSNMGAVIYFTPSQISEAEEYSKMIGNDTVTSKSQQHSKSSMFSLKGGGGDSETDSYQSRALMLPQELLSMSKDSQLVVRSGIPVIKADKIRYFEDAYFKERFNAVPMHEVTIGSERRKVPVPTKLPKGNWDSYTDSIKGSEYYVALGASADPAATAVAAPDITPAASVAAPAVLDKAPQAIPAPPAQEAPATPSVVPPAPQEIVDKRWQGPVLPEAFEPYAVLRSRLASAAPVIAASTRVAQAYADAIVRYWEAATAAGQLHDDEVLTILDLTPGAGSFAWQLLNILLERLQASAAQLPAFQYVACASDEDERAALQAHLYFDSMLDRRTLFVALRDEVLGNADAMFDGLPLVVLSQGLMAAHSEEILTLHDGAVSGVLARAIHGENQAANEVTIETQHAGASGEPRGQAAEAALAMYRESLGSGVIALPAAGLRDAEDILRISGGNYLWLSADPALADEREFRAGAYAPPGSIAVPAPVQPANYHALSWYLRESGAGLWLEHSTGTGIAQWAALGDADGALPALLAALQPALAGAFSDEIARVPRMVAQQDLSLGECLSLLQRCACDPRCLEQLFPVLLKAQWPQSPQLREQWQQALARSWAMYLPPADASLDNTYLFLVNFTVLAIKACHFALARAASAYAVEHVGDHPEAAYLLAEAEHLTGRLPEAIAAMRQAMAQQHDSAFEHALEDLEDRRRRQDANVWFHREAAATEELRLEPLASHHAPAMLQQFRDRQLAAQTMLPALTALADTEAWIAAQSAQPGRMTCAVMHRDWGLVGAVSLYAQGGAGLFYFWIGPDHQGRGYGVAAATTLLMMAQDHAGIHDFFAASGNRNAQANAALDRIGFRTLDASIATPNGAFGFHYIGEEADDQPLRPRLAALCQATGLPLAAAA
jgi:type IV secretion system protein VirD4